MNLLYTLGNYPKLKDKLDETEVTKSLIDIINNINNLSNSFSITKNGSNYYFTLPNGLLVQFGQANLGSVAVTTVVVAGNLFRSPAQTISFIKPFSSLLIYESYTPTNSIGFFWTVYKKAGSLSIQNDLYIYSGTSTTQTITMDYLLIGF